MALLLSLDRSIVQGFAVLVGGKLWHQLVTSDLRMYGRTIVAVLCEITLVVTVATRISALGNDASALQKY